MPQDITPDIEKQEDDAHASGDTGAFVLGVRNDNGAATFGADGDYTPIATDSNGRVGISDLDGSITVDGTVSVTEPVSVDDNGGSLTVDAPLATPVHTRISDGTDAVNVSAAGALQVDGSGVTQPVSGTVSVTEPVSVDDNGGSLTVDGTVATNAEKAEDAAHASGAIGNFVLGVRNSAGATLTDTDGDYSPIAVTSTGAVANDATKTEDAVHGSGAQGSFVLGVRNDAAATTFTSTDGDYSPIATDAQGRVGVSDLGGTISIDDGGGVITVDGTVSVTEPVSVDDNGGSLTVDQATASNLNAQVVGEVAHDDADSGNPVKIGGRAVTSLPTAVVNNDRVNAAFQGNGALIVTEHAGTSTGGDGRSLMQRASIAGGVADDPLSFAPYAYNGATFDRVRGDATNGLDVDVTRLPASTNTIEVVGDVAQDVAVAGNPLLQGWRASTAVPAAMSADGDSVYGWANRSGAPVVTQAPHVGLNSDPWNLVHEAAQYTTTQTSTVLVAGGASEKIVVTQIQIQAFDTVAGDVIVYFGTGAYARGTNRAIFDGTFKPSATLAPGYSANGPFISGTNGDDILVTTTNNVDVTISVWYYVVV